MNDFDKFTTVGIVGRTNAGKSTLLNSVVKKKISAVTAKVNTTRTPLTGIYHFNSQQFLLLDAPGVCQIKTNLDRVIFNNIVKIIEFSNLIWWLIDVHDPWQKDNQILAKILQETNKPIFLLINKIDLVSKEKLIKKIIACQDKFNFTAIIPISAKKSINFSNLIKVTLQNLQIGKKVMKKKVFSLNTFSEIAKEIIREQIIKQTKEEIPHQTALLIEHSEIHGKNINLEVNIVVATKSQKSIILGKNGSKIKEIRIISQNILEKLWKQKPYLFLKVKVQKNWYQDLRFLNKLKIDWENNESRKN